MSDHERSKARTEALHRVLAARNNLAAVLAGRMAADQALRSSVALLDQAAEWLEGEAS